MRKQRTILSVQVQVAPDIQSNNLKSQEEFAFSGSIWNGSTHKKYWFNARTAEILWRCCLWKAKQEFKRIAELVTVVWSKKFVLAVAIRHLKRKGAALGLSTSWSLQHHTGLNRHTIDIQHFLIPAAFPIGGQLWTPPSSYTTRIFVLLMALLISLSSYFSFLWKLWNTNEIQRERQGSVT